VQFGTQVSSSRSRSAFTLEELEPEHLRVDRDRMRASSGSLRFVDELVGLDGLLGNGVDSAFKDLPLLPSHARMLARRPDEPSRHLYPPCTARDRETTGNDA